MPTRWPPGRLTGRGGRTGRRGFPQAWGAETEGAVRTAVAAGAGPREQYEAFWRQVIASYDANRWLWLATIEAAVQAEHSAKLRELMAASLRQGRTGLAAGLLGIPEDTVTGPGELALGRCSWR